MRIINCVGVLVTHSDSIEGGDGKHSFPWHQNSSPWLISMTKSGHADCISTEWDLKSPANSAKRHMKNPLKWAEFKAKDSVTLIPSWKWVTVMSLWCHGNECIPSPPPTESQWVTKKQQDWFCARAVSPQYNISTKRRYFLSTRCVTEMKSVTKTHVRDGKNFRDANFKVSIGYFDWPFTDMICVLVRIRKM